MVITDMELSLDDIVQRQLQILTFNVVKAADKDNYALFKQYSSQIASLSEEKSNELLQLIGIIFAHTYKASCSTELQVKARPIMMNVYQHLVDNGFTGNPLVYDSDAQNICLSTAIMTGDINTMQWIYSNTEASVKRINEYFMDTLLTVHPNSYTLQWYIDNISSARDDYTELAVQAVENGDMCLIKLLDRSFNRS